MHTHLILISTVPFKDGSIRLINGLHLHLQMLHVTVRLCKPQTMYTHISNERLINAGAFINHTWDNAQLGINAISFIHVLSYTWSHDWNVQRGAKDCSQVCVNIDYICNHMTEHYLVSPDCMEHTNSYIFCNANVLRHQFHVIHFIVTFVK